MSTDPEGRPASQWLLRSADGRLTLWQFPNPALGVWLVTLLLSAFDLSDARRTQIQGIGRGALIVWAVDEILRGASPFRRLLGTAILIAQLSWLTLH